MMSQTFHRDAKREGGIGVARILSSVHPSTSANEVVMGSSRKGLTKDETYEGANGAGVGLDREVSREKGSDCII